MGVLQTPDQTQQMDADSHGQKVLKSFHCQTCSIESIGFFRHQTLLIGRQEVLK